MNITDDDDDDDTNLSHLSAQVDAALEAHLIRAGWHLHKWQWRRRHPSKPSPHLVRKQRSHKTPRRLDITTPTN